MSSNSRINEGVATASVPEVLFGVMAVFCLGHS